MARVHRLRVHRPMIMVDRDMVEAVATVHHLGPDFAVRRERACWNSSMVCADALKYVCSVKPSRKADSLKEYGGGKCL